MPDLSKEELDYIQCRILPEIQYYSRSSRRTQKEYYILSILNIVIMAAVPVIAMLPETVVFAKYIAAAMSALASILSSVLLIRHTKDNWIEYRKTSELLKSELAVFKAGVCGYQTLNQKQRFSLFVGRCEGFMQSERDGWYSRKKQESNQAYGVSERSEDTGS